MTDFDPIKDQIKIDEAFMKLALALAEEAFEKGEVPVGAVVVHDDRVIAKAHNQTEQLKDATAHAEMIAITSAANFLNSKYLEDCTLYVTLEPCAMCATASHWSQVPRIVYGAIDLKKGFESNEWNVAHPRTELVSGVLEAECATLLKTFFQKLRN